MSIICSLRIVREPTGPTEPIKVNAAHTRCVISLSHMTALSLLQLHLRIHVSEKENIGIYYLVKREKIIGYLLRHERLTKCVIEYRLRSWNCKMLY